MLLDITTLDYEELQETLADLTSEDEELKGLVPTKKQIRGNCGLKSLMVLTRLFDNLLHKRSIDFCLNKGGEDSEIESEEDSEGEEEGLEGNGLEPYKKFKYRMIGHAVDLVVEQADKESSICFQMARNRLKEVGSNAMEKLDANGRDLAAEILDKIKDYYDPDGISQEDDRDGEPALSLEPQQVFGLLGGESSKSEVRL